VNQWVEPIYIYDLCVASHLRPRAVRLRLQLIPHPRPPSLVNAYQALTPLPIGKRWGDGTLTNLTNGWTSSPPSNPNGPSYYTIDGPRQGWNVRCSTRCSMNTKGFLSTPGRSHYREIAPSWEPRMTSTLPTLKLRWWRTGTAKLL